MALYSISEENLSVFDKWSQKSVKYSKQAIIKQWNGYRNCKPLQEKRMLGKGSLIYWAKQGGYTSNNNIEYKVNNYPEKPIVITETQLYDVTDDSTIFFVI